MMLERRSLLAVALVGAGIGRVAHAAPSHAEEDAVASYDELREYKGPARRVRVVGFAVSGAFEVSPGADHLQDDGGTVIVDRSGRRWRRDYAGPANVRWFGAAGDGQTDDTRALQAAVDARLPLHLPAGVYLFSRLGGLDRNDLLLQGDGSSFTVLKFTGKGDAITIGRDAGFTSGVTLRGFTVEGNANTVAVVKATCLARSIWSDINVREANAEQGVGFLLRACMLNRLESLMCSQNRQAMSNPPKEGLRLERLGRFGNCSNNSFVNAYLEGRGSRAGSLTTGIVLDGADQNVFLSGSAEACADYGLTVSDKCRFNTFLGTGFENKGARGDILDRGISSKYLNCYSSQATLVEGRQCSIEGGYYERVQISRESKGAQVARVTVNHWSTGAGGLFDDGDGTVQTEVYDERAKANVRPKERAR